MNCKKDEELAMEQQNGRERIDRRGLRARKIGRAVGLAVCCAVVSDWPSRARADAGPDAQPLVYSGVLEEGGQPVTAARLIALSLYDAEQAGTQRCAVPLKATEVDAGRFSIALPAECSTAVHDAAELWVEIQVDEKVLSPRTRIASVPYALEATRAADATGTLRSELDAAKQDLTNKLTVPNGEIAISPDGNVGIATAAPSAKLEVDGNTRLGAVTPAGQPVAGPGWGPSLFFSGGPNVEPGYDSDNSDPLSIARYNVSSNATELRVIVGDDPSQGQDKLSVGVISYMTGEWTPRFSVGMDGNVQAVGSFIGQGMPDIAETIATDAAVESADAVCADLAHRERAVRCKKGDTAVLGVIASGASSFLINARGRSIGGPLSGKPLVLAGRVPVKVSLENGPIQTGDFLALSSVPGVAMRAREPGPVVGIALEPYGGKKRGQSRGAVLRAAWRERHCPARQRKRPPPGEERGSGE